MNQEIKNKVLKNMSSRNLLLNQLVSPARAAANQMKDAGMKLGSDPIFEILFQLDVIDQEMKEIVTKDPETLLEMIFQGLKDRGA